MTQLSSLPKKILYLQNENVYVKRKDSEKAIKELFPELDLFFLEE